MEEDQISFLKMHTGDGRKGNRITHHFICQPNNTCEGRDGEHRVRQKDIVKRLGQIDIYKKFTHTTREINEKLRL